jgi:hypothetical protein
MLKAIIILSMMLYFGFAEVNGSIYAQAKKNLKLRYGYSVQVFPEINCFEGCNDLNRLIVFKNGRTIFKDSTHQYSLDKGEIYPLLLHFNCHHNEILLSADNNVIRLNFESNQVPKIDTLPYFGGAVRDSASLIFTTRHFDDFAEVLDVDTTDSCKLIYDPFLIYRLTKHALTLDSDATEGFNLLIYRHFYGFARSDSVSFSLIRVIEKWADRKEHLDHLYLHPKTLHAILNNEF